MRWRKAVCVTALKKPRKRWWDLIIFNDVFLLQRGKLETFSCDKYLKGNCQGTRSSCQMELEMQIPRVKTERATFRRISAQFLRGCALPKNTLSATSSMMLGFECASSFALLLAASLSRTFWALAKCKQTGSPSNFKCCLLKMLAFNGRVNSLFVSEMIADARWLLLQLICILQGKQTCGWPCTPTVFILCPRLIFTNFTYIFKRGWTRAEKKVFTISLTFILKAFYICLAYWVQQKNWQCRSLSRCVMSGDVKFMRYFKQ